MNALDKILKLGNPLLYEQSVPVKIEEIAFLKKTFDEMHDILFEFRKIYGMGRAIAAPQIGVLKRIIYMHINGESHIIINPELHNLSYETFELWDDCLSFPSLLVKVRRHKSCTLKYMNELWEEKSWEMKDDLSELIQHEYDHLEGILAVQRAIDSKAFKWNE